MIVFGSYEDKLDRLAAALKGQAEKIMGDENLNTLEAGIRSAAVAEFHNAVRTAVDQMVTSLACRFGAVDASLIDPDYVAAVLTRDNKECLEARAVERAVAKLTTDQNGPASSYSSSTSAGISPDREECEEDFAPRAKPKKYR